MAPRALPSARIHGLPESPAESPAASRPAAALRTLKGVEEREGQNHRHHRRRQAVNEAGLREAGLVHMGDHHTPAGEGVAIAAIVPGEGSAADMVADIDADSGTDSDLGTDKIGRGCSSAEVEEGCSLVVGAGAGGLEE